MVKGTEVKKSEICFKIKLAKIMDKYLRMKKFFVSLNFFKDYSKSVKETCKESGIKFK